MEVELINGSISSYYFASNSWPKLEVNLVSFFTLRGHLKIYKFSAIHSFIFFWLPKVYKLCKLFSKVY